MPSFLVKKKFFYSTNLERKM